MLPVLIVCYLRPEKLRQILESLVGSNRRIYIYIDRAPDQMRELNEEVHKVAREFAANLNIAIQSPVTNQGVKLGVPRGIDWVLSIEKQIIVVEDDCFPTQHAYEYFDKSAPNLSKKVVMVCGTSPVGFQRNLNNRNLTYSNYPLIWGWATSAENWAQLRVLIESSPPHKRIFKFLLMNPKKILVTCYFYAAAIRINRGKMQAWDALVALEMIISKYKSIIPDKTLVTNTGRDDQANHFAQDANLKDETVSRASIESASEILDQSQEGLLHSNSNIERNVYNIRFRHLFSPFKALFGF